MGPVRRKVPAWGGLLLLVAALFLALFNLRGARRAEEEARAAAQQLRKAMAALPSDPPAAESAPPRETVPPAEPLPSQEPPPQVEEAPQPKETEALLLDGYDYLGILEIPALGLTLPVLAEWSDANLKLAPCRYQGTAEEGDLILAGHNYRGHFGGLYRLRGGDRVTFQNVEGPRFCYAVSKLETIPGTGLTEMEEGAWDLTLFTCTLGGRDRLTVRCCLTEE